ncbi:DUF6350 family protein [Agromyces albus]|uniref:Uncharacterized protein n=1 Tax=Agromyces albus TaxID=205332 RepID=A0A4Q2KXN7_9MICO|nr:DUF6350 family protein [Agromyces albus]RXZ69719.1 hypothetical protein ESP51_11415 [Agromyces albus]
MRRTTIALLAALEASVAALIGLGIVLVPLMLLWAVHFGLSVDVSVFLRTAADVWLLGHGVDLELQLDAVTAARTGLPAAGDPFTITIALLGFALLSVVFGLRIGRRAAAGGHSVTGGLSATLVYALVGAGLALAAGIDGARPSLWQGALLPAFAMALGVVIGAAAESHRAGIVTDAAGVVVRGRLAAIPPALVAGARVAVRIGAGAAFGVLALGAVLVAVLVAIDYATIAGLYQSLGAGIDGGIALTVGELAFVPNLVVWATAWLLGPGFAIGAGTAVSPGGTLLGPVPGIPLLGALPTDVVALGGLWLIAPVLLGFVGAWLAFPDAASGHEVHGPRAVHGAGVSWWHPLAVGAGAGGVAALVLGVLAWWSGGAAGPGRLAEVGPNAWAVAGVAAATVGVGAIVGSYAARARGIAPGDEPGPREREGRPGDPEEPAPPREFIWGAER